MTYKVYIYLYIYLYMYYIYKYSWKKIFIDYIYIYTYIYVVRKQSMYPPRYYLAANGLMVTHVLGSMMHLRPLEDW